MWQQSSAAAVETERSLFPLQRFDLLWCGQLWHQVLKEISKGAPEHAHGPWQVLGGQVSAARSASKQTNKDKTSHEGVLNVKRKIFYHVGFIKSRYFIESTAVCVPLAPCFSRDHLIWGNIEVHPGAPKRRKKKECSTDHLKEWIFF